MVLDPLSAISLAGNIISFIDFSSKVLPESQKICKNGTGNQSGNFELESVAGSLRQFSLYLKPSANKGSSSGEFGETLLSPLEVL